MSGYDVASLQVLSPKDHVRLRRGMYIGDSSNPSPLFNEIFDNALDEQSSGFSDITKVSVNYLDNTYEVSDQGRGFPQGMISNPNTGKDVEALELLCTSAFSGGKFNSSSYRLSSGLNGVGLLVTNSLSQKFKIETWREGSLVRYTASRGDTESVDYSSNDKTHSGTCVMFNPDPEIFTDTKIPLSHIMMRCKIASAFGMKNILTVTDKEGTREVDTSSNIYDLLPPSDEGISEYYRHSFTVKDETTGEYAAVALQYTSDTKSYYRGYTNLLYNSQGGTHHKMLDSAIYDAWSKFNVKDIKWNDVYLGLRGVVAVFISNTEFSSQSKERLSVDKKSLETLRLMIVDEVVKWLSNNDEIRESLIKRFQEYRASQNRLLARKEIRSLLYVNDSKNGQIRRQSVVRKLRDCDSKSREGTELHVCEGDSALGGMLPARDPRTQAILPIRGKILNVSRLEDLNNALKNEEIRSIINAIGAGVGESADPSKSRYDKIIFYTDSDADGAEIRVLLAGIFINLLPELVKSGMVYTAVSPLYGYRDRKGNYGFTNYQSEIPKDARETFRYKGLGEMDPDELWESCMNPDTRRLVRINYPDDLGLFNSILTSSSVKYQMLVDSGVIKNDQ